MWRKILIINLLFMLVLQPAAQAIVAITGSADAGKPAHHLVTMDCGQIDPGHCVDHDNCAAGNHGGCDSISKVSSNIPALITIAGIDIYDRPLIDRFSSHHTDILLRPPQNS
jgi:hypothetical protein